MGLTPEQIERRDFTSTLRGYDRDEVRMFLTSVASTVRELQSELSITQAEAQAQLDDRPSASQSPRTAEIEADRFGAIGERVAELLRVGHASASELRANAEAEADHLMATSRASSQRMTSEAETVLRGAQGNAERLTNEARAEAENVLAESRHESETLLARAEGEAEALRIQAQAEADELRQSANDEADRVLADAEANATELRHQANSVLTEIQTRADELWSSAEAEAFKLREDGRVEAEQIREAAIANATNHRETAEREVEALRLSTERDVAAQNEQAELDVAAMRSAAESECEDLRSSAAAEAASMSENAERLLEDSQTRANNMLEEALVESERVSGEASTAAERLIDEGRARAEQLQAETDSWAAARREEAESYFATKQQEAHEYVATRHREADDYVSARQGEVYKNAAEAEAERDRAIAGIADAREQVQELLEQARAQSEFVRHEAEELIRIKVRNTIDQAETRIAHLRITEQASRERIKAAQTELIAAIAGLGAESANELGEGAEDLVLAEAEQAALGQIQTQPETGAAELETRSEPPTPPTQMASPADEHIIDLDAQYDSRDSAGVGDSPVGHHQPRLGATNAAFGDVDPGYGANAADPDTTAEDAHESRQPNGMSWPAAPDQGYRGEGESIFGDMPYSATSAGAVTGDHNPEAFADYPQPAPVPSLPDNDFLTMDLGQDPGGMGAFHDPEIEPEDEDALSRLVREAMQRAVQSAKGGDRP